MVNQISSKKAMAFIILMGIISLFADMTYEGARSITGQYLAILGASGAVVGTVAGAGELIGYGFRLVSGYVSDKTRQYWLVTIVGYSLNLLAVPLLALAENWPLAASLIILERFGKAIRSPAKDAMLSYATHKVGRGWGFGLHEAMDQTGAILGPLLMAAVLYYRHSYELGFALLLIPALCALSVLGVARWLYPSPQDLEVPTVNLRKTNFGNAYRWYIVAICCVAAGYVDFPLIAFHFKKDSLMADVWTPVLFSIAMAAAGISALVCGKLYDKIGFTVLLYVTALAALFVPLVFWGGFYSALLGLILWGIGLGAQESILRAVVADMIVVEKRGTAYGVFNMAFGLAWFAGSALMGFLYDVSLPALIVFSVGIQLAAVPVLARCTRYIA